MRLASSAYTGTSHTLCSMETNTNCTLHSRLNVRCVKAKTLLKHTPSVRQRCAELCYGYMRLQRQEQDRTRTHTNKNKKKLNHVRMLFHRTMLILAISVESQHSSAAVIVPDKTKTKQKSATKQHQRRVKCVSFFSRNPLEL